MGGRVNALLDTAGGLHPEFSGYENVRAALELEGVRGRRIADATQEIAEFTELGRFLDQPFKTYSLGMQAAWRSPSRRPSSRRSSSSTRCSARATRTSSPRRSSAWRRSSRAARRCSSSRTRSTRSSASATRRSGSIAAGSSCAAEPRGRARLRALHPRARGPAAAREEPQGAGRIRRVRARGAHRPARPGADAGGRPGRGRRASASCATATSRSSSASATPRMRTRATLRTSFSRAATGRPRSSPIGVLRAGCAPCQEGASGASGSTSTPS